MRLNYFGYYIKDIESEKDYLYDLRPFLKAFCKINNAKFKNQFLYNGEHIYLFKVIEDIYLFVITRSQEIIKRINTDNLKVNEIYDILDNNENLGFASYVYFGENFLAFAYTILAPKITGLSVFIDSVFKSMNLKYRFCVQALLHKATKDEALSFPIIGKTTIELSRENSLIQDIAEFISAKGSDFSELNSIEIIIKPKRKKNIKPFIKKFLKAIPEDDSSKMIVKAKKNIADQLIDLYIVGKGVVSDLINTKDERKIYDAILNKVKNNKLMLNKLQNFTKDERFEKKDIEDISKFSDTSSWTDIISSI